MDLAKHCTDTFPLTRNSVVLQPQWRNPVSAHGSGVELVTKLTLNQLCTKYREQFIRLVHAAQFAVVYCRPESIRKENFNEDTQLDMRPESDMIPHTDKVNRDNGVSLIVGESPISTGVISTQRLAYLCHKDIQSSRAETDVLHELKQQILTRYKYDLAGERDGYTTRRESQNAIKYLNAIRQQIQIRLFSENKEEVIMLTWDSQDDQAVAFWSMVQAIQSDAETFLLGEISDNDLQGYMPAVCVSEGVKHFKSFTKVPRETGAKQRVVLLPNKQTTQWLEKNLRDKRYVDTVNAQGFLAI